MNSLGMTIPGGAEQLSTEIDFYRELEALGYTALWSLEVAAADGFVPLALAAAVTDEIRLGLAVAPVHTRGPAILAQTAAALGSAAPGRFMLGLGTSSKVIVEDWNATPFDRPRARVRDTARFLRQALQGGKVSETYETFAVENFSLGLVPEEQPQLFIAGMRPRMIRLAGEESEGVVVNWLSAEDVRRVAAELHAVDAEARIVCRIPVVPIADPAAARDAVRRAVNTQLNIPVYAASQEWHGRGELLAPMWKAWQEGDRKGALAKVPDQVIDELIVHGSPEQCSEHIERFVANGVTDPTIAVVGVPGVDWRETCRALAPASR
jgi:probable F420-dependent oxidoreductase